MCCEKECAAEPQIFFWLITTIWPWMGKSDMPVSQFQTIQYPAILCLSNNIPYPHFSFQYPPFLSDIPISQFGLACRALLMWQGQNQTHMFPTLNLTSPYTKGVLAGWAVLVVSRALKPAETEIKWNSENIPGKTPHAIVFVTVHSSPTEVHIDFIQFSQWPWVTEPDPG